MQNKTGIKILSIKIRKIKEKELPELYSLFKKVLEEDFPEYQPRVTVIYRDYLFSEKFFLKRIKSTDSVILGAFLNNELVGFIVIINTWERSGVGMAEWLIVKKPFRKSGVGTRLLTAAESWSLKHFIHHLYLHTYSDKNVEFYKKRGFEHVGLLKNAWFGVGENLFQKVLREKPFEKIFKRFGV